MQNRKRDTDVQNRLLGSGRRQGWDDLENGLGLVHWEDPEGWDGEGGGRGDQDGEHM